MGRPKGRQNKRKPWQSKRPKIKDIQEVPVMDSGVLPPEIASDIEKMKGEFKPGDLADPLEPIDPDDDKFNSWTRNHALILDAMDKYTRQYKHFPSYVALARITGLTPPAVKHHFDTYDWTRVRKKAQFMTEKIVFEMYNQITTGKVKKSMINLYFKIINQWRDGIDINVHSQHDFRILAEKVQSTDNAVDRTRNVVSFLSAINGRMDAASVRNN